jgi:hypothetical protein
MQRVCKRGEPALTGRANAAITMHASCDLPAQVGRTIAERRRQ